jgi:hypothetical protein
VFFLKARPPHSTEITSKKGEALEEGLLSYRREADPKEIVVMKTFLLQIVAIALLGGLCVAQQASPPPDNNPQPQEQPNPAPAPQTAPSPGTENVRIAPGSVIPAQLTKSIDAKKVKTGDVVEAKVTQDLKAQNGQLILAKDTKVLGRITEAQPRTKEQKQSQLGLVFEKAVPPKDATGIPLPMSIQAIVVPSNTAANDSGPSNQNAGQPVPSPSGGMPASGGGRMSSPSQAPTQQSGTAGDTTSADDRGGHPPITGETRGVVGNTNLKLSDAANATEGSLVSSEKSNVKLESGTLLLLRVN